MTLSEQGTRIMSAARDAYAPTGSDRTRNRRALALKIAVGASTATSVATGSVLSSAAWKIVLVGLVASTTIAGGTMAYEWTTAPVERVERAAPSPSRIAPSPAPTAVVQASEPSAETDARGAREAKPSAMLGSGREKPQATAPALSSQRKPEVEAEVALLREARSALSAGDAARALALTDTHAREFPRGVLGEERSATRVVALCALGRVAEGRREAQAFLARSPSSPLAERVRKACSSSESSR